MPHVPHIVCKSTGVELEGGELRRLCGELSLHGVTRTVVAEVERFGPVTSQDGETSIGLRLSAAINREDHGMNGDVKTFSPFT